MSKTYIPQNIRQAVLEEQQNKCFVCTAELGPLDLHHVQPEYAGGKTVKENLTPLCSNHLGGNACHILAHAAYRTRERVAGRKLTQAEYQKVLDGLHDLISG